MGALRTVSAIALAAFVVAVGAASCSGGPGPSNSDSGEHLDVFAGGACTAASACTSHNGNGCVETNLSGSLAQQACPADSGTFADTPCSRTGAVGACRTVSGPNCNTTWYYASSGATADTVQQICAATHATFVSP